MLTIRFQPMGRKHHKFYRIVLADKKRAVSKKFLEKLGWYNPYTKECSLNRERLAQLVNLNIEISNSVRSLLQKNQIISNNSNN